jgi:hypothetical protein
MNFDQIMIENGFMIDITPLQKKMYIMIDHIEDPIDFSLILKPYLSHVNSRALNSFHQTLCKNITDKKILNSEAYWLVLESRSNDRIYNLLNDLNRRFHYLFT